MHPVISEAQELGGGASGNIRGTGAGGGASGNIRGTGAGGGIR